MIATAGRRTGRPSALVALTLALTVSGTTATPAQAQDMPRPASLRLTVIDQLGAIIVGAIVQVVRAGQPEDQAVLTVTNNDGVAGIEGLAPGTYLVRAMFEGFDTVELRDLQLRAGQLRR